LFPKQIYIKSDYLLSTLLVSFAGEKGLKNTGGFAHPPSRLSGGLPPQGGQTKTLFAWQTFYKTMDYLSIYALF
jgi:hypothetical protein